MRPVTTSVLTPHVHRMRVSMAYSFSIHVVKWNGHGNGWYTHVRWRGAVPKGLEDGYAA
jgi:hypothetical protein